MSSLVGAQKTPKIARDNTNLLNLVACAHTQDDKQMAGGILRSVHLHASCKCNFHITPLLRLVLCPGVTGVETANEPALLRWHAVHTCP